MEGGAVVVSALVSSACDGIAGICDPEPSVSNTVVLFSGFDPATRTHFALTDGAFDADAASVSGARCSS